MKKRLVALLLTLIAIAAAGVLGWGGLRASKSVVATTSAGSEIPTTRVKRGRVTITVSARGELQGGNSEMLVAPMAGIDTMAITSLRDPGELVNAGDVVVEFDTTQQEFNLREAQADLLEAGQLVIQATATSQATQEEAGYQLESTSRISNSPSSRSAAILCCPPSSQSRTTSPLKLPKTASIKPSRT